MNELQFRDPIAREHYERAAARIAAGEQDAVRGFADAHRLDGAPVLRLAAATAYAALAAQLERRDELREAAFLYHFAGQVFRGLGMTSKAGDVYRRSFRLGIDAVLGGGGARLANDEARKLQAFNLQSIGRAVNCYRDAGQTALATACQAEWHDAEVLEHRLWNRIVAATMLSLWKHGLRYSLSWTPSLILAVALLLGCVVLEGTSGRVLGNLAIVVIGLVAFRRLR